MAGSDDMQLFAKMVELRSISGAARQLGISKSGASRRLAALEQRLGVRLLYRSSRAVRPTEAGAVYYEGCQRVLAEVARAETEVSRIGDSFVGRLRVHGPTFLGADWLSPAVVSFLKDHPTLDADLVLSDTYVDLIENFVDVAIRVSPLLDSSLVVRKLARVERVLCASPSYLASGVRIQSLSDFKTQDWIQYSHDLDGDQTLQIEVSGQEHTVGMSGRIRTNSATTIRGALLAGLGVTAVPRFVVADALNDGRLTEVFPMASLKPMWLAAVFPHTRRVAAKVKGFVEYLLHDWPPPAALGGAGWLGTVEPPHE